MKAIINLYGEIPVLVSIEKNQFYKHNSWVRDYSPDEEPYYFEILETEIEIDEIGELTLYEEALQLLLDTEAEYNDLRNLEI